MKTHILVEKNRYFDSITLMSLSQKVRELSGVSDCQIAMGTDHNKALFQDMGFNESQLSSASAQDLIIGIIGEASTLDTINSETLLSLIQTPKEQKSTQEFRSISEIMSADPEQDLALISVPGEYAAREAGLALDAGLHVMMFSDNVSLEKERHLKEKAIQKDLFMMGPDCGTAILEGLGLGFANAISRGPVGIVGASGTGIQEVSCLLDDFDIGVSHAIGTGGRDLHEEIGGLMALKGIDFLSQDKETELICLISKPPHPEVAKKILSKLNSLSKASVICFLGTEKEDHQNPKITVCSNLTETALAIAKQYDPTASLPKLEQSDSIEISGTVLGLFCGGTLCSEAKQILGKEHDLIDYGDDEYTKGRPHPMIDPSLRAEALLKKGQSREYGAILLDFVLGFGSHSEPVDAIAPFIQNLQEIRKIPIFASVTGSRKDPQRTDLQKKKLKELGVILAPSNALAASSIKTCLVKEKTHVSSYH